MSKIVFQNFLHERFTRLCTNKRFFILLFETLKLSIQIIHHSCIAFTIDTILCDTIQYNVTPIIMTLSSRNDGSIEGVACPTEVRGIPVEAINYRKIKTSSQIGSGAFRGGCSGSGEFSWKNVGWAETQR